MHDDTLNTGSDQEFRHRLLRRVDAEVAEECVELFIGRHARGSVNNLVAQFPKAARRDELAAYPPAVAERLRALGHSPMPPRPAGRRSMVPRRRGAVDIIGALFFSLVLISIVVGLVQIFRWVGRLFR